MKSYPNALAFASGVAAKNGAAHLIATFDEIEDDEELTRQSYFDLRRNEWKLWDDTEAIVTSLCVLPDRAEILWWLTEEGQVGRTLDFDESDYERIEGSGVHNATAQNWGYLNRLRYLQGTLYAIGNSGQVYRRVVVDKWEHVDAGLLQSPITADRPGRDMINLNDIGGPAPNDLYACGDYRNLWHWDGTIWTRVEIADYLSHLQEICVVSADEIYICGYNGCLLKGNVRDGFKDVSAEDVNVSFLSVHRFNNQLFLACAEGLYVYDGTTIKPYASGLKPELQDAHQLDSADGVLWSFGYKDLAYFNGSTWTRVDHPDNPPIR